MAVSAESASGCAGGGAEEKARRHAGAARTSTRIIAARATREDETRRETAALGQIKTGNTGGGAAVELSFARARTHAPVPLAWQKMLGAIKSSALALREALALAPPRGGESAFAAAGQLTPDEFERAGERLVAAFPSWRWCAAEPGFERAQHAPARQFLLCAGVPCLARVDEAAAAAEESSGWLVSARESRSSTGGDGGSGGCGGGGGGSSDEEADLTTAALAALPPIAVAAGGGGGDGDDDDDYLNMAALVGVSLSLREDAAAVTVPAPPQPQPRPRLAPLGGVVRSRSYDVSVSYDRHYRVPRLWLRGVDDAGRVLSAAAMLGDVQGDHADRTVTVEQHPLAPARCGPACLSIHPCRHADVLKSIIDGLAGDVDVADALVIFLKLCASVVPTIAFDCTRSVSIGMGLGGAVRGGAAAGGAVGGSAVGGGEAQAAAASAFS